MREKVYSPEHCRVLSLDLKCYFSSKPLHCLLLKLKFIHEQSRSIKNRFFWIQLICTTNYVLFKRVVERVWSKISCIGVKISIFFVKTNILFHILLFDVCCHVYFALQIILFVHISFVVCIKVVSCVCTDRIYVIFIQKGSYLKLKRTRTRLVMFLWVYLRACVCVCVCVYAKEERCDVKNGQQSDFSQFLCKIQSFTSHFHHKSLEINIGKTLTPIERQFSSGPCGNLTTNFDPAFSSESFNGRKRHTTLMLSSAGISRSADIFSQFLLI